MPQNKPRYKIGELVRVEDELAMFSGQQQNNIGIVLKVRSSTDYYLLSSQEHHYEYKIYWQDPNENVDEWMPEMFLKALQDD